MSIRGLAVGLIGLYALASCVEPTTSPVTGPSGAVVNTAKCSSSSEGCFKAAAKTCNGSYQVLDSYSKAGGLVADLMPGPVTWYYMSYQCGKSDGRMPTFDFRGQSYQPPPVIVSPAYTPRTSTTNCRRFGNSVSCTSY